MPHIILVTTADGKTQEVKLEQDRLSVGRSTSNELCYPEDGGMSRHHMVFEREGDDWVVRDLGSKNGTFLNALALTGPKKLQPGDKVMASHVEMVFDPPFQPGPDHTVIFETSTSNEPVVAAVSTTLEYLLSHEATESDKTPGSQPPPKWLTPVQAVVRASRELSARRPLPELFNVILDLAIEAVGAERGVLMTVDGGRLAIQASRGEGFRVSTAVCDKVVRERASLLIRDAQEDAALKERQSIVLQQVRTLMAVPLQTDDQVIGLIYVDTLHFFRQFSSDDLNLLTLMANVAAVRIERERLAEVEEARRLLDLELQQAAEIQMRHLPSKPPAIVGLDLAGHNAPCRTVGGDYFDFLPYPDGRVGIVVADVAGKGMPASLLMMSLQARVQMLGENPGDPGTFITRLNRNLALTCPKNRFISLFLCVLNPATGEAVYCNAGHNPPLLVRASGAVEEIRGGGPVLGILGSFPYESMQTHLEVGDTLVMYSDGVTEASNAQDEEFGDASLAKLCVELRFQTAEVIQNSVLKAVSDWSGDAPPADDITIIVARRLGS